MSALSCISPFDDGEYFDYGIWIPADEYQPLTPTPSVSEDLSSEGTSEYDSEEEPQQDLAAAFSEKVDKKNAQECFKQLAKGGNSIPSSKAADYARSVGLAPSKEDEERFLKQHPKSATFEEVQEWLVSIAHPEDDVDNLCKFFGFYDKKSSGRLSRGQMLHLLTNMGDNLTPKEADAVLSAAGQTGDPVDYRAVVMKLLEPSK